jgi:hypothetical protein
MKPVFICEHCRTSYLTEQEATACEGKHVAGPVKIVAMSFESPDRGGMFGRYPSQIQVRFGGKPGWVQTFNAGSGHTDL